MIADWTNGKSGRKRLRHFGMSGLIPPMPGPVKAPFREGMGWDKDVLDSWTAHGGWASCVFDRTEKGEGGFMDLEEKALSASESVRKVVDGYMEKMRHLKSTLQNDSASIKASAERVEKEHARMNAAMQSTISLMTSPEMAEAIANAERLAVALKAIGEAKSASAQFALVVD